MDDKKRLKLIAKLSERGFEGVWFPASLWFSKELTFQEKGFYLEIKSLDGKDGCFANNEHFALFFRLSKSRVSDVIASLKNKKFISVSFKYKSGSKEIEKRIMHVLRRQEFFGKDPLRDIATPPLRETEAPLRETEAPLRETDRIEVQVRSKNLGKSLIRQVEKTFSTVNDKIIKKGSSKKIKISDLKTDAEKNTFRRVGPTHFMILGKCRDEIKKLDSELMEQLFVWLEFKKGQRQTYNNEFTIKGLVQKFEEIGLIRIKTIIQHSITLGYNGLIWDLKEETKAVINTTKKKDSAAKYQEFYAKKKLDSKQPTIN